MLYHKKSHRNCYSENTRNVYGHRCEKWEKFSGHAT